MTCLRNASKLGYIFSHHSQNIINAQKQTPPSSLFLTHWITRSWVWGPHSCPLHTQLPTQHVALCWLRRWLLLGVLNGSHVQYTLCYRAVNLHWGDQWCHQGSGEEEGDREKDRKRHMGWRHIGLEVGCAGLLNTLLVSLYVLRSACLWLAVRLLMDT